MVQHLPKSRAGSGDSWMAFIKQAWSSASGRVVKVSWSPPESPAQVLFTTTQEASVFCSRGPLPALPSPTPQPLLTRTPSTSEPIPAHSHLPLPLRTGPGPGRLPGRRGAGGPGPAHCSAAPGHLNPSRGTCRPAGKMPHQGWEWGTGPLACGHRGGGPSSSCDP